MIVSRSDLFHARACRKAGGEFDGADVLPSAAVGVVSARHGAFSGDVLRVDAEGAEAAASGAVLLKATAGGQDVFEVKVSRGMLLTKWVYAEVAAHGVVGAVADVWWFSVALI